MTYIFSISFKGEVIDGWSYNLKVEGVEFFNYQKMFWFNYDKTNKLNAYLCVLNLSKLLNRSEISVKEY